MVPALLTAIRIRLGVFVVMAVTKNRPVSRSKRICGSLTELLFRTELKNALVVVLRPPTAPDLSKTLMRPLAAARICVLLTSPLLSGGTKPDSPRVAARKLVPMAGMARISSSSRPPRSRKQPSREEWRIVFVVRGLLDTQPDNLRNGIVGSRLKSLIEPKLENNDTCMNLQINFRQPHVIEASQCGYSKTSNTRKSLVTPTANPAMSLATPASSVNPNPLTFSEPTC